MNSVDVIVGGGDGGRMAYGIFSWHILGPVVSIKNVLK